MVALAGDVVLQPSIFEELAELAQRESGIVLAAEKRLMVQSRLRARLRALQLPNFAAYTDYLRSDLGAAELRFMISALTTNVSHFFREPHHFDMLKDRVLPVMQRKIDRGDRIRIWSAGCSNGQEPYSIAMDLLAAEPRLAQANFRILATDIDPRVIAHARRGSYQMRELDRAEDELVHEFLVTEDDPKSRMIADEVKSVVAFRELNLLHGWPMKHPFDAIFCRNVVIYFDVATQEGLWPRFAQALAPEGLLFLGHSERIADPAAHGLEIVGPTAYAHAHGPITRTD